MPHAFRGRRDRATKSPMIKLLADAVERLEELPEDRQHYIARVLDEFIADAGAVHALNEDERRLVREGLADLDAGRIVSDADMQAFWSRHDA